MVAREATDDIGTLNDGRPWMRQHSIGDHDTQHIARNRAGGIAVAAMGHRDAQALIQAAPSEAGVKRDGQRLFGRPAATQAFDGFGPPVLPRPQELREWRGRSHRHRPAGHSP